MLRDTDTLKLIGMVPIFDSGNAMFWDHPNLPLRDSLENIPVNSMQKNEMSLLAYFKNPDRIDLTLLPDEDELRTIYSQDPLITWIDALIVGYSKKIRLLERFG